MSKLRNSFPSRTNQKLYFARLQLDMLAEAMANTEAFDSEPRALSAREAAIWHLHSGMGALFQELSKFYKVQPASRSAKALREAMAARGQRSPEAEIILGLAEDPYSWVSCLKDLTAACYETAELPEMQFDDESPARIAITMVMTEKDQPLSAIDLEGLHEIHRELTNIIRYFRAELVEF
jgi:hypothetical protein